MPLRPAGADPATWRQVMNDPGVTLQHQQDADTTEAVQDLRFAAGLAELLSVHLREYWPVQGQGTPIAGPPNNATATVLHRYLLHLKTILVRFRPPTLPTDEFNWYKTRSRIWWNVAAEPLMRIDIVCNHLIDQFGMREVFEAVVDGQFKALLTPTLHAGSQCRLPDGRPIPEIDPQDIRALEWAAMKLLQAVGTQPESATRKDCETPPDRSNPDTSGAHYRDTTSPESKNRPRWDKDRRELWFGKKLLKRFSGHSARNQVAILVSFEETGWAPRIDSPFPRGETQKLKDAMRGLNKVTEGQGLRFRLNGAGDEGLCWEAT
jgi:hypothetical protein